MTKSNRAKIIAYLANTVYDTSTVRASAATGMVTAIKDADKTFSAPETVRHNVGWLAELLTKTEE